ncbi:hypothetical protein ADL03_09320 [Nocardia sp. NRRL S-836]|nr:hypothetical protein ADL03_09320 [Nocardia sp. NRRL S-836]
MYAVLGARGQVVTAWCATASGLAALLAAALVPADAEQGPIQKLMYLHVPAAWLAYLSFTVVFVAGVAYLRTGQARWDRLGEASAEAGVVFAALTIVLGALWGRPVWGTWWTWDPRLTTTAVLLLTYLGYLAVRRLPDSPARAYRWAAVIGVAGFVNVPIVHLSVVWWRSLHQPASVLRVDGPTVAAPMLVTLLLAVVAFTFAYLWLVGTRMRLRRLEERLTAAALGPAVRSGR